MCNRYVSPSEADIERQWHIGGRTTWRDAEVYPAALGRLSVSAATLTPILSWWSANGA